MKLPIKPKNPERGFTLVEMLVVITIIVILAGLTIAGFGFINQKQAREQTKIQIGLLKMALEDYKADMGEYPEHAVASGKGGTPEIYKALYPNNPENPNAKVYLSELNPENDQQNWLDEHKDGTAGLEIKDPWGKEYFYRTNPASANPKFDLWSAGPDGKTSAPAGDYDADDEDNLDDIRGW